MLDGLWYGIAAAFIFIGVVATSYFIILQVFKVDNDAKSVIVIPSGISDDDLSSLIYSVRLRMSFLGDSKMNRIIVVDDGMTLAQKQMCRKIIESFDNMELCVPENLWTLVSGKEK